MKINTSLELVRYIRHHLAGSEFQDVKAVEDFVDQKCNEVKQLYQELLMAVEKKYVGETRHQTALRFILLAQSNHGSGAKTDAIQS